MKYLLIPALIALAAPVAAGQSQLEKSVARTLHDHGFTVDVETLDTHQLVAIQGVAGSSNFSFSQVTGKINAIINGPQLFRLRLKH